MPGKTKETEEKVKVLKGQEAEDCILKYMQQVNRPYGAIDINANLKGAVAKAQVPKILTVLVEKGHITQKNVGKSSFFVASQAALGETPKDELGKMEEECKQIDEELKRLQAELKSKQQELINIRATPTDANLESELEEEQSKVQALEKQLEPLRMGVQLVSAEELERCDAEWIKWRAEWVHRRRVGQEVWGMFTDAMPPPESEVLAEQLGMEPDSDEHRALERGPLCAVKTSSYLKRKIYC